MWRANPIALLFDFARAEFHSTWKQWPNVVLMLLTVAVTAVVAAASRSFALGGHVSPSQLSTDVYVRYAVCSTLVLRATYPKEYGIVAMDLLRRTYDRYRLFPRSITSVVLIEALAATLFWGLFVWTTLIGSLASPGAFPSLVGGTVLMLEGAVICISLSLMIELSIAGRNDIWSIGLIFRMAITICGGVWYPLFADATGPLDQGTLWNPLTFAAYQSTKVFIGQYSLHQITLAASVGAGYAALFVLLAKSVVANGRRAHD